MKSLIFSLILIPMGFTTVNASEVNFEIYHPSVPAHEMTVRPNIPKLSSPEPMAKVTGETINLEWLKVETATAYSVQVSDDPIFFNLLVDEKLYQGNSMALNGIKFESGKNYYWRVAAIKEDNQAGRIKSLYNRSSFQIK